MKKINLQNIKDSLTKNELSKIMAGSGDINNSNAVENCCLLSNSPVVTNNNSFQGCSCHCS